MDIKLGQGLRDGRRLLCGKQASGDPCQAQGGKELGSYAQHLHVWPSRIHWPRAWAPFEFTEQRSCLPGPLLTWPSLPHMLQAHRSNLDALTCPLLDHQSTSMAAGAAAPPNSLAWFFPATKAPHSQLCSQRRQEALILVWKMLTAKPLFKI